ncbi:ef hand family protein [Stylonychia lemnae]|uniref:Ef hand family protein n=1 Tax=Stylonychia lemnae TaxID=5949 RepID=A0A078BBZ8_STYLE|nr:ef hand family protein [Stylonychia lemnae]|eukprot:CDW91736.1 ef hand family protein [Stylonychia lemnae]
MEKTQNQAAKQQTKIPFETILWVKKHCPEKAKIMYKKTKFELKKHYEVENVFNQFDEDGSQTLDVNELFDMFQQNQIYIEKEELQELFELGNPKKHGEMTLEEFINFASNQTANHKFRKIMKRLRREMAKRNGVIPRVFLPFNLNTLMDYLSKKTQRDKLLEEIDKSDNNLDKWQDDINKFEQLFMINKNLDNKLNSDNYIYRQIKMAKHFQNKNHSKNQDEKNKNQPLMPKTSCKNAENSKDLKVVHLMTQKMLGRVIRNNTLATIQESQNNQTQTQAISLDSLMEEGSQLQESIIIESENNLAYRPSSPQNEVNAEYFPGLKEKTNKKANFFSALNLGNNNVDQIKEVKEEYMENINDFLDIDFSKKSSYRYSSDRKQSETKQEQEQPTKNKLIKIEIEQVVDDYENKRNLYYLSDSQNLTERKSNQLKRIMPSRNLYSEQLAKTDRQVQSNRKSIQSINQPQNQDQQEFAPDLIKTLSKKFTFLQRSESEKKLLYKNQLDIKQRPQPDSPLFSGYLSSQKFHKFFQQLKEQKKKIDKSYFKMQQVDQPQPEGMKMFRSSDYFKKSQRAFSTCANTQQNTPQSSIINRKTYMNSRNEKSLSKSPSSRRSKGLANEMKNAGNIKMTKQYLLNMKKVSNDNGAIRNIMFFKISQGQDDKKLMNNKEINNYN